MPNDSQGGVFTADDVQVAKPAYIVVTEREAAAFSAKVSSLIVE
jgi:hypothetical protein